LARRAPGTRAPLPVDRAARIREKEGSDARRRPNDVKDIPHVVPDGIIPDGLTIHGVMGIVGVALYISAYGLLQAGVLRGTSYTYTAMNLVGSALVLVSLSQNWNLASALIQIAWVLISIAGLVRIFLLNHRIRFNAEETALVEDALADMPRPLARRLLDRGLWMDGGKGLVLTDEGAPVERLHYLAGGAAEVIVGGHPVATLQRGFIGEMNVLAGGPASATVRLDAPSRLFTISGETLRRTAATDAEFRLHLEQRLHEATRRKLVEANRRNAGERAAE
jgi:CRP-like cAMP-binding protein